MLQRPIPRIVLLAIVTGLAIAPFFHWGSPSGHDFEFHLASWMEVLSQWKQGIVYPRWAALAHWGYGEARFLFYPPASWSLGAALGAVLPWKMVPGAFCWIALTLAGASMYGLARQWLAPPDALFAGAFYAANPYHLIIVYWRSAYAELLAAALAPLLLLWLWRLDGARPQNERDGEAERKDPSFRPVLWLSLIFAAAWLTNGPAALMIHYSAAGLAVVLAIQKKSLRPLSRMAVAMVLAAGLASFYLVPAIYEQNWVNIGEVLSPGVRPQDNFLFTLLADTDHNRFNLLVSIVALAEIVVLACVMWCSRRAQSARPAWMLVSSWGAGTAFVMLPASRFLWQHLPKFRFVQLPFRWLLCLNVALALLLSIATAGSGARPSPSHRSWSRLAARALACAFLLGLVIFTGQRTQPPWWEVPGDFVEMNQAVADGSGYQGTDEYVPAGGDPYELKKDMPRVSDGAGTDVNPRILQWDSIEKHLETQASRPETLTIRQFNYPAWKVTVNGNSVETQTADSTGLMMIPVSAQANDVHIRFARTLDRSIGDLISVMSLCLFGVAWRRTRSRRFPGIGA